MSTKLLKFFAVVLMMLALGCVVGAILASNKRVDIQGPSALAVLPDQTVWVSVEDALWHLDANGNRLAIVEGGTLGLGGGIGSLMLHSNGQMVAQIRNDSNLYFLDPQTAQIQSRLLPQWESDLLAHSNDAINYAFHEDGRVAIATGGGHAVAVFDQDGRFLGRTKPGTYEFTNGLWWAADRLWTTDTNRQQLVELDGNTLAELSRIQLSLHCGGMQYLGVATPSHGKASGENNSPPLITLVRFANGMIKGRVSDIFGDGTQLDYPTTTEEEPRDLKWHGNELLLVDGASFSIKRFSDTRILLGNFGDAQVQADLAASLKQRNTLQIQYFSYLSGAIFLFLLGFGFALRMQALEKTQALAALNVDMSHIGTPILTTPERLKIVSKLFWPLIVVFAAAIPLTLLIKPILRQLGEFHPSPLTIIISLQLLMLFAAMLVRHKLLENQNSPALEALFNQRSIQLLKADRTFWKMRLSDELPLETLMLISPSKGAKWLVLTNQRLLVFTANLLDRTLSQEYPRENILRLQLLKPHEMTWQQRLMQFLGVGGAMIRFEFKDGTALTGFTNSAQTARRIVTLLQTNTFEIQAMVEKSMERNAGEKPPASELANREAIKQSIASFLLPGMGQWMQRRSGTALIFFVIWLFALMSALLVGATLWKALAAVSARLILYTSATYLFICIMAAWDTWRMRGRTVGD